MNFKLNFEKLNLKKNSSAEKFVTRSKLISTYNETAVYSIIVC